MKDPTILLAIATALLALLQITTTINMAKLKNRIDLCERYIITRILMDEKKEDDENGSEN